MSKDLKISVITPSFNSAKSIERAIQSVREQDYLNWEHIIVDGASTDGTVEILKKYPHLKWTSEKDKSQEEAMNKGFARSTGEVIVYLNADDYFFPGAFSAVIEEFKKGAKFVVGNVLVKSPRLQTEFLNIPRTTFQGMLRHWEPNAFCHNPVGYFYLREVQATFPINENSYAIQDLEFLLNAATKYPFTKIERTLGCYEDGMDTKTARTQSKLDYWQPSTFRFLDKFIARLSPAERLEYEEDRRMGYAQMQARMNEKSRPATDSDQLNELAAVSIIIPIYNCAEYIERAVNSVLAQELDNFEIIVVDDASTDNTQNILKKYQGNSRVKVVQHSENNKLGASRNTGLDLATGKYIFFLDSDDWLEAGALKQLVFVSEKYQTEIAECGIQKVYENGRKETYHSYAFACQGGAEALYYYADYMIGSIVWNKLYLREFLEKNKLRFTVPYWHEDVMFTAQAIYNCKKYVSIGDLYYNYFQRETSIINSKQTFLHLESYIKLYSEMSDFVYSNQINQLKGGIDRSLLRAHCFNTIVPQLTRYAKTYSQEWEADCFTACYNIFGATGGAFADVLIALAGGEKKFSSVRPAPKSSLKISVKQTVKRYVPAWIWRPLKSWYHKAKFKIVYGK